MPHIELTEEEIDRIDAAQRIYYLHVAELVRLGQTHGPAWDSVDENIHRKLRCGQGTEN